MSYSLIISCSAGISNLYAKNCPLHLGCVGHTISHCIPAPPELIFKHYGGPMPTSTSFLWSFAFTAAQSRCSSRLQDWVGGFEWVLGGLLGDSEAHKDDFPSATWKRQMRLHSFCCWLHCWLHLLRFYLPASPPFVICWPTRGRNDNDNDASADASAPATPPVPFIVVTAIGIVALVNIAVQSRLWNWNFRGFLGDPPATAMCSACVTVISTQFLPCFCQTK